MFRITVRVSCISGSRSPQPVKSNKGISTSISQRNFRLNPILLLNRSLFQKKHLIPKGNDTVKIYVIFPLKMFPNSKTQCLTSIGLFCKNWEIVEVCLTGGAI